jgi:hypothetical protein
VAIDCGFLRNFALLFNQGIIAALLAIDRKGGFFWAEARAQNGSLIGTYERTTKENL